MKKFFAVLGSVLLISFLISCSALSSSEGSTSLIVQLPSTSARSAETPEWAQSVSDYSVTLEQVSVAVPAEGNPAQAQDSKTQNLQPTYKKDSKVGGIIEFKDIQVGEYTVTVYCFDSDGSKVGEGSNTAIVREGEQSSVKITISQVKTEDADSTEEEAESEQKESDTKNTDEEVTSEETKEEAKNEEAPSADDANTDKTRTEPVTEEKPVSDDSQDETLPSAELTYGGTVSLNGTEYSTLAEALVAANQTSPSSAHTITLNGNIKENLLTISQEDSGETQTPWLISQNLIINLNENTLSWAEFTDSLKNQNNQTENPLFHVASRAKLLIKNGTITSESGVEHSNILLGTTGGTIALENVTIKNVNAPYILSINSSLNESGATENLGALYCDSVTIKNCKGLKTSIEGTESLGVPISINASEFYAKKMTIENTIGANGLHAILMNSDSLGSFVGGSITLNNATAISKEDGSAIALISSSLYVSSSTIFANSDYYGAPVKVVASGQLNLSKGFQFKTFKEDRFDASYEQNDSSEWITAETLGLEESESRVVAGTSVSHSASTQTAIVLGKKEESTSTSENEIKGQLFVSGKASVYGVVDLFFKSSIGVTGALETSETETIKVKFKDIASYASASGDYPLFWASGSDIADENKENAASIATKFEVYGDTDYTISATDRKIQYAGDNNAQNGNTIYAPVQKTE